MKYFVKLDGCRKAYPDIKVELNFLGILKVSCRSLKYYRENFLGFIDVFNSDNPEILIIGSGVRDNGKKGCEGLILIELVTHFFEEKDSENDSRNESS